MDFAREGAGFSARNFPVFWDFLHLAEAKMLEFRFYVANIPSRRTLREGVRTGAAGLTVFALGWLCVACFHGAFAQGGMVGVRDDFRFAFGQIEIYRLPTVEDIHPIDLAFSSKNEVARYQTATNVCAERQWKQQRAVTHHGCGNFEKFKAVCIRPQKYVVAILAVHIRGDDRAEYRCLPSRRLAEVLYIYPQLAHLPGDYKAGTSARKVSPNLSLANATGFLNGSISRISSFSGLDKGLLSRRKGHVQEPYSNGGQSSGTYEECCCPKRHVLLGPQILVGYLISVIGFHAIRYAQTEGFSGSVCASACYFLAGYATITFSILLISGIGTVYFRVF